MLCIYRICSLGVVREVGRRLFNCTVTCEVLERSEDINKVIKGVAGHSFKEYVQFELHITENDVVEGKVEKEASNTLTPDAGLYLLHHYYMNCKCRFSTS